MTVFENILTGCFLVLFLCLPLIIGVLGGAFIHLDFWWWMNDLHFRQVILTINGVWLLIPFSMWINSI